MNNAPVIDYVNHCLKALVTDIGIRPAGSEANRQAEAFIRQELARHDYAIEIQSFPCPYWLLESALLEAGGVPIAAVPSIHSPSCDVEAPLAVVNSIEDLLPDNQPVGFLHDCIVLVGSALCGEGMYFFPKNFDFFRDSEQDRLIAAIEACSPRALILVSPQNRDPLPMIMDSEIAIPSVTIGREQEAALAARAGQPFRLTIKARSLPGSCSNIIARSGVHAGTADEPGTPAVPVAAAASGAPVNPGTSAAAVIAAAQSYRLGELAVAAPASVASASAAPAAPGLRRIVLCGHYDTAYGTPGALDNASGTVALLALAALLPDMHLEAGLELVFFGGEDSWYPCDAGYFKAARPYLPEVGLAINIDGVGLVSQPVTVASFNSTDTLDRHLQACNPDPAAIIATPPWYQSDHAFFAAEGIPSLAFSSHNAWELLGQVVHKAGDDCSVVDPGKIALTVDYISRLLASNY